MDDGLLLAATWRQGIVAIVAVLPIAIHLFLQWKRGDLAIGDDEEDQPES